MSYIKLVDDQGQETQIAIDDEAKEAIRLSFNPSQKTEVFTLKMLAAALFTYCNYLQDFKPEAGREFAVAKTNLQTASMWAVSGATKGL